MPGLITGQLYQQFAVTITFSTINALTLSPALRALLLRPPTEKRGRVFGAFNRALDTSRNWYLGPLARLGRQLVLASVLVLAMFGGIYGLFRLLRLTTEGRYE